MNIIKLIIFPIILVTSVQAQDNSIILKQLKKQLKSESFIFSDSNNDDKLKEVMQANPERWKAAFDYILKTDLNDVANGTYELIGKECFVTISEYQSKEVSKAKIESHEKYTDIQMVISGVEDIGLVNVKDTEIVNPYNENRDVAFYRSDSIKRYTAPGKKIFVFFPGEIHQPGLAKGTSTLVKKLVIKVLN